MKTIALSGTFTLIMSVFVGIAGYLTYGNALVPFAVTAVVVGLSSFLGILVAEAWKKKLDN